MWSSSSIRPHWYVIYHSLSQSLSHCSTETIRKELASEDEDSCPENAANCNDTPNTSDENDDSDEDDETNPKSVRNDHSLPTELTLKKRVSK
jgi:hypothetical protein